MRRIKLFRIWAAILSMVMVLNTVGLDLYAAELDKVVVADEGEDPEGESNPQEEPEETGEEETGEPGEEEGAEEEEDPEEEGDSKEEEEEDPEEEGDSENKPINIEASLESVSGITVENITAEEKIYTGNPVEFGRMRIYYDGVLLTKGVDYNITYKNNKNAYEYEQSDPQFSATKAPSFTITGIGNYSGTVTKYFTIERAAIDTEDYIISDIALFENGVVQKPVVPVNRLMADGKMLALRNNVDYVCTYNTASDDDFKKVGEYIITVTGIGNYCNSVDVKLSIVKGENTFPADRLFVEPVTPLNINLEGGEARPKLTVKDGTVILVEGRDYSVEYKNNTAIGTGIAIITGSLATNSKTGKAYDGQKTVTFKIVGTAITQSTISYSLPASKNYDGEPVRIDSELVITDNEICDDMNYAKKLVSGTDYLIFYSDNDKAGRATVTIMGIGGYTGVVRKQFTINGYDMSKDTANIKVMCGDKQIYSEGFQSNGIWSNYSKDGAVLDISVWYKDKLLKEGTDYTLNYTNNRKVYADASFSSAYPPTLVITGKNGYKGSLSPIRFTIKNKELAECNISAADREYAYKEGNYIPVVTITDTDGKKLVAGTDYNTKFEYYYYNTTKLPDGTVKEAGEAVESNVILPAGAVVKLVVEGKGSYKGKAETLYRITESDIAKATIKINTQYYNGKPVVLDKADVVVICGGRVIGDEEYDIIEYANNTAKGTAKATFKGIGNIGGTKVVTFTIANKPFDSTITFSGNGAVSGAMKNLTLKADKTFDKQTKIIPANLYKRPGYIFKGWNTASDGSGESFKDKEYAYVILGGAGITDYPVSGNVIILYAQWEAVTYSIKYHTGGGENNPLNTRVSYCADDAFDIYAPEMDTWPNGYQFGGWYKESSYVHRISKVDHGSTGDLDLYAKWIPYTYTITFDKNAPEGKTVKGSMGNEAFSFNVSKALTKNKYSVAGYGFAGWALSKDAEEADFTDGQKVDQKVLGLGIVNNIDTKLTLYAVWKNKYSITFNSEGGINVPDMEYGYGEVVKLPTTTRVGYTFAGWYKEESLKTRIVATAKKGENLNLYAKWTPIRYTVIFNKNAPKALGTMPAMALDYDAEKALTANRFINKGYRFTEWNTKADGTGEIYYDGDSVCNLSSVKGSKLTLYAIWEESDYNIEYVCSKGTLDEAAPDYFDTYTFGEARALPVPVREGYTFKGWYSDAAGTKRVASITKATYGDLKLYAFWVSDKSNLEGRSFDIAVYNLEDGKIIGAVPDSYTYGSSIALPSGEYAPVRDGYVFGGWYRDPGLRRKITSITSKDNDDIDLYIKWVANKYKITFKPNAPKGTVATGRMADKTLNFGKRTAIGKNAYKIKGYTFMGWSYKEEGDIAYADNEAITGRKQDNKIVYGNMTLHAIWEKDEYTITYYGVDGIANYNKLTYNVDDSFVLYEPEAVGNTFVGWYTDSTYRKKITSVARNTTGNLKLYAKWTNNTYTLLYDLNDGGDASTVLDTSRVGYVTNYDGHGDYGYILPTATRRGYTFGGWCKDAAGRVPVGRILSAPNVDMTLYAKWNPIKYKINYMLDGGTNSSKNPAYYVISNKDITLSAPTKLGYEFMGWFTDAGLSIPFTSIRAGSIGDITVYAKWKVIRYTIHFNANGGTGSIASVNLVGAQAYTLPSNGVTKKDYTLQSWNTKANGSGTNYALGSTIKGIATKDGQEITLYAIWKDARNPYYLKMIALKSKYPEGTPWTNDNYYGWKGGMYSGGFGCAGFAFMLSDAAFGDAKAKKHTDFRNIRVGDIVRMNNDSHSVIVLTVENGVYTVAEGNYGGKVHWGRTITQSEFDKANYVLTRY